MVILGEADLGVPDLPVPPKIVAGDYLAIDVGEKKKLQFKTLTRRNDSSERPVLDPVGYLWTKYDEQYVSYLAGQVLANVYQRAVTVAMKPQVVAELAEVKASGYYHLMVPIKEIDPTQHWYLEAHFEDDKNGIVLVMGTVYFFTIEAGKWSALMKLKGGESNGQTGTAK